MEQGMTPPVDEMNCIPPAKRGFLLVTVLVITAVGLLFGAGALLLFRYQCQMRIDRQHEMEKVYAVRSALNYIGKKASNIKPDGTSFGFRTTSERKLNLLVKPVNRVFPDFNNPKHLDIRNDGKHIGGDGKPDRVFYDADAAKNILGKIIVDQYSEMPDYEYGSSGTTNQPFGIENFYAPKYGLKFPRWNARRGAKWWVNIGMPGTQGWLHEKYGRRYFFEPRNYVDGPAANDAMRLCIIRDVTNRLNDVGCKHGWPLSSGERAIVLEFRPLSGDVGDANALITLSEYLGTNGEPEILASPIAWRDHLSELNIYVGVQIAGDKITVFRSDKGSGDEGKMVCGWVFYPEVKQLTPDTYNYFLRGHITDVDGEIVESSDLRAVLEVEASADSRPLEETDGTGRQADGEVNANKIDFLTDFRVTPAYQFDVFLEHPVSVTNRATVVQLVMTGHQDNRGNEILAVRTYDTHGTEHKGFRKDEKDFEESKRAKGH